MLRIRYWLMEKSWRCEKRLLVSFWFLLHSEETGFCMFRVNKDTRLHYECLVLSKINPYIFATLVSCLDQMGYNNCGYSLRKTPLLAAVLLFQCLPLLFWRHKQKPLVTSSRSVTSFSKHEMSCDTNWDKPKQMIPKIQVNYIMKCWCKCIISEENMNKGSNFQLYWKKKWIRTKEDLVPSAENVIRNPFWGEFLI